MAFAMALLLVARTASEMVESDHNNLTPQKQGAWTARSKEGLDTILHGGQFQPRD